MRNFYIVKFYWHVSEENITLSLVIGLLKQSKNISKGKNVPNSEYFYVREMPYKSEGFYKGSESKI